MPRILFVKTSSLGDIVHNCPAVSDAARHVPGAAIDWVVEEAFAEIAVMHASVRRVIPIALRRWRGAAPSSATWSEAAAFRDALRGERYDAVIDSQGLIKSAAVAALARGRRHGFDRASAREALAAYFYDAVHAIPAALHAVERNRRLAGAVLGYVPDRGLDYGLRVAGEASAQAWRARLARPVLLLASTREGEEKLLLEALPDWDGKLLVLVVPRHARRFDEVVVLWQSRRSRTPNPAPDGQVHLGDSMGEMDFYCAAADVAVIGGSFVPRGGQNLIEACAAGVPAVFGPSMFNFAEAARLAVAAGAARQAGSAAEAMREIFALLADSGTRAAMGEAGRNLCQAHRGATRRHLELCREFLRAPARG